MRHPRQRWLRHTARSGQRARARTDGHSWGTEPASVLMNASVWRELWRTVGSRPAETGGILLGPRGKSVITEYYFDAQSNCSAATYSPDHGTINGLFAERWTPRGLELKGAVHSHPSHCPRLSREDLEYVARILGVNPRLDRFFAPVILAGRFWMRPFLVHREGLRVDEVVLRIRDDD